MHAHHLNPNNAYSITPQEFLRRMSTGGPHTVLVQDVSLAQLGPNVTWTTQPLSAKRGDMVGIRINRGALTANTPEIRASSPTGGVAIAIEPQGRGAIGAASTVHVNIALEAMPGGLDHRTVYVEDQNGRRLLSVRIPLSDVRPNDDGYERKAKTVNLGELRLPGAVLANTTRELRPGDTLQFDTRINQIWGLGEIKVTPEGALAVKEELLEQNHMAGDTSKYRYQLKVPRDAQRGSEIEVKTSGHYQTRNDPNWAFSFKVKVV